MFSCQRRLRSFVRGLALVVLLAQSAWADEKAKAGREQDWPWDVSVGQIQSRYTAPLLGFLRSRLASRRPIPGPDPSALASAKGGLWFRCLETEGSPFFMGFEQHLIISAPLDGVAQVLDRMDNYAELFPGYESVKFISRERNRWLTHWEQEIPIPLVPNIHFEMEYVVSKVSPMVRLYRYQLHSGESLKSSDGAVILQSLGGGKTLFSEWDFYDAHWGIASSFGRDRIWRENAKGILLSTLAVKMKAEKPELSESQALKAAERFADDSDIDFRCQGWQKAQSLFPAESTTQSPKPQASPKAP